jgi:sulfur carrier protein
MSIVVNGAAHRFEGGTLYELLISIGLDPERPGIAVAVNGEVVSRVRWRELRLNPDDVVEIVTAVSGG